MASWEEASHCPKCKEPGKEVHANPLGGGRGKLVTLQCENSRCRWFNTTWIVQVRPDGTIPDADTSPRGRHVHIPPQDVIDAIQRNAERTHEASKKPGSEVRR